MPACRILGALLWEQWRVSRLELAIRSGLALAGVLLFATVAGRLDSAAVVVLHGVAIFIFGMAGLLSASWTNSFETRQLGFVYHLGFTRPVATRWLVLVPLAYAVICSQLIYVGCCLALYLLVGWQLPVWGPAAILACAVCVLIAGAWSSTRLDGRIAGMLGAMSLTLGWLGIRDYLRNDAEPILLALGRADYFALTWWEYLGLGIVGALASLWTIVAVDQQRHGEAWLPRRLGTRSERPAAAEAGLPWRLAWVTGARGRRSVGWGQVFRTPLGAQFWYEVSRSAGLAGWGAALLCGGLFAVLCLDVHWPQAPRAWMLAGVAVPLIVQLLAADQVLGLAQHQGVVRYSSFDATRPLHCDQLIAIKMAVIYFWSLLALMQVVAWAGCSLLLSGEYELWRQSLNELVAQWAAAAHGDWRFAVLGLVMAFFGSAATLLTAALAMAALPRAMLLLSWVSLMHVAVMAWDASHQWAWWPALQLYGYGLLSVIAAASVVLILLGLWRGHVRGGYFLVCLAIWGLGLGLLAGGLGNVAALQALSAMATLALAATALVTLAGAACAPWALALHRHA